MGDRRQQDTEEQQRQEEEENQTEVAVPDHVGPPWKVATVVEPQGKIENVR